MLRTKHIYRKRPVLVEAIQFNGKNKDEIMNFVNLSGTNIITYRNEKLHISTLEGQLHISTGDWIVKGIKGEFYPCKPDIFKQTYEKVGELVD